MYTRSVKKGDWFVLVNMVQIFSSIFYTMLFDFVQSILDPIPPPFFPF